MASLHLSKRKRVIMLVLALIAVISTVIFSVAVFTDRVNRTTTIQVSTFDDDGYAIERTAPDGYFTAGETVEVTLKESNNKSENITSQITMTVAWDCPVPNTYPWGNTTIGNAAITLDGEPVTYTVNADQTISFTLPEKDLAAKSTDVESILNFQIPSDLAATGKLDFRFDEVELGYASWTTDYDRTDLSSLDFGVGVAWNVSKKQTTTAGNPNRDVIAILTEGTAAGQYGLEIIKNGSDDNTNNGQMMDWTAKAQTPWAAYTITDLTLDEGVTSVGDYAFAGETGITNLNFPGTLTVVGTSAFDGIGLSGELVIPASIQKIESLAFGNLPNVTAITFEHTSGDALDLPNNTSAGKETSGAFYVPSYVKTTFEFNGNSKAEEYNWVNDKRMKVGITEAELTYEDVVIGQTVDPGLVIQPDNYEPYQSIRYEVLEGSEFASVDPDTGVVTGLKQGNATVQVTIVDANGDTITTTGTVKVLGISITDATLAYDDVVVGQTVDPDLDLLPENHGPYQSIEYEVTKGSKYASVDPASGIVTGLKQGTATVKVTIIDTNGIEVTAEAEVKVLGIGITKATLEYDDVVVGQTVDPGLTLLPENHDAYQSIHYEVTEGETYASVDADTGVVTGLKQGTATVKVTIIDTNGIEVTASATVNVLGIGITKVTLDYDDVVVGETVDPDLDILPENHDKYQSIKYEVVSGSQYAKVEADTGVVTGLKQGTATVKVTIIDTNGDEASAAAVVNVLGIGIEDVTLSYDDVVVGETVDPDLDIQPDDYDDYQSIEFEIIDGDEYAEVDPETGEVTGLKQGTATVKVTIIDTNGDEITDIADVNILGIGIEDVTLSYDDVVVGQTVDPDLDIQPDDYGDYQSKEYEIVNGDEFASVDPDTGEVTGLKQGTATVKVTIIDTNGDEITAEADVNVLGIGITKATLAYDDVAVGDTVNPDLTILPTNYDKYQSIKYEVISGSTYASVHSSTGVVTGLAKGTATIRVTIVDTNGEKVTAEGTVNVYLPVPTLAAGSTWFDGATSFTYESYGEMVSYERYDVDYITIVDSYLPTGDEVASWDASEAKNKSVMGYLIPDSNDKLQLILAGNGYGKIFANKDSSFAFSHPTAPDDYPEDVFYYCSSISGLNLLDTSNATTMKGMFAGSYFGLESLDLSSFNTTKVTDMSWMFYDSYSMTSLNVSTLNTSNVTDMSHMFDGCDNVTSLNVTNFKTSNVKDMTDMFRGCGALTSLDVSSFDTTLVQSISGMFLACDKLVSLDLTNFNTGNVTTMYETFLNCTGLTSLKFGEKFTTAKVENMSMMFSGCESLPSLDVTGFDTSEVTDMSFMFAHMYAISNHDLSSFDTSNVTNMSGMFYYSHYSQSVPNLAVLDLSHFVTSKVTDMSLMFSGNSTLTTIYATHRFNTSAVTEDDQMFYKSTNIIGGAGTAYNSSYTGVERALVDGGTSNPGYFTNNIFLAYDDVNVGATTNAQLTIKSAVFDDYTSIAYKVISGGSYATVNATTGTVTGVAAGTATIQVTLGAANGDTITAQAPVTVINPVPTLAAQQTWYTQGGTTIDKSTITSIDIVDSYDTSGKTIVSTWDASAGQIGTVTAYVESDGTGSTYKLTLAGNGYGRIYANADSYGAFRDFTALTAVNGATILDTSNTTTMCSMFNTCSELTTLDTSTWNTGKVEDMSYMFIDCGALETLNVSDWDTGAVTDADHMFSYCYKLSSLDVSGWDTGSMSIMRYMFNACQALTTINVTDWDVTNVTKANDMFQDCYSLETLDVSKWTFSTKLTDTSGMFNNCESLKALNVANWIMDSVVYIDTMFNHCESLTTLAVDNWDVGSAQKMDLMFSYCSSLASLNVSNWDTSSATNMEKMFRDCPKLATLAVDNWDVSSVTNMRAMFLGCSGLTTLNVSDWETTSLQYVTSQYGVLRDDESYYWDLGMFEGCSNLAVIDISGWDMDQITNNAHMFSDCTSLESLTIPASLKIISPEFAYNCTSLTEIIFNHSSSDALSMPTAGEKTAEDYTSADENGVYSDGGAFYVPSYVETDFDFNDNTVAEGYDWAADNRASLLPVLASDSDWYDQGDTDISRESITSIEFKDSYTPSGTVVDSWDASDGEVGTVTAYIESDGSGNGTYKLTVAGNGYGSIYANEDSSYAFSKYTNTGRFDNVTSIIGLNLLDTSNVTDMEAMFYSCESLTSLDLSTWDTRNVKYMTRMFAYCKALTDLDLSSKQVTLNGRTYHSWDTDAALNMQRMFIFCQVLPSLDLSHFDTSDVTKMDEMFNNCRALASLNLSSESLTLNGRTFNSWDTGKVQYMNSMFSVNYSLSSLDVSHFDTSSASTLSHMFTNCTALTDLNVSSRSLTMNGRTFNSWDTCSAQHMDFMFSGLEVLPELDVSHLDTSGVLYINEMFSNCYVLTDLDLSTKKVTMNGRTFDSWDTGSATTMDDMFNACKALPSLDVSHFDTTNVTTMNGMFYYCEALPSIGLNAKSMTMNGRTFTSWQTGSVTDMSNMFCSCDSLTALNLSHFNTESVTTMNQMFRYCENLTTLNISSFDTSSVTEMGQMFSNCFVLPSLDLSNFDTGNVEVMYQMFAFCHEMVSVKFGSKFTTSKVYNMAQMFNDCNALTSLDLSTFDTSAITSSDGLAGFAYNTRALVTITLNANFVTDATLLPPSGFDPPGMFYCGINLATKVINATDVMKGYDWSGDKRTVTFG